MLGSACQKSPAGVTSVTTLPGHSPEAYIGDGVERHLLLVVVDVEDRRSIAGPHIVALAVLRRRIVNLEEELE